MKRVCSVCKLGIYEHESLRTGICSGCRRDTDRAQAKLGSVMDAINHPSHYTSHPSGVECLTITEHFNFNLGNVIKYVWRAGLKSTEAVEDLKKAEFYIKREIARMEKAAK